MHHQLSASAALSHTSAASGIAKLFRRDQVGRFRNHGKAVVDWLKAGDGIGGPPRLNSRRARLVVGGNSGEKAPLFDDEWRPIGSTAGYIGSIYSPGVRNSAGEFSSSQPIAANPLFKSPTDNCRCLLPIGIRWIKRIAIVTSASPEFRTVM